MTSPQYIGSCVDIGTNDFASVNEVYPDATHLAYALENYTVKLTERDVLDKTKIKRKVFETFIQELGISPNREFSQDEYNDVFVVLDIEKDIHYFFKV